jgi:hypothetical protein
MWSWDRVEWTKSVKVSQEAAVSNKNSRLLLDTPEYDDALKTYACACVAILDVVHSHAMRDRFRNRTNSVNKMCQTLSTPSNVTNSNSNHHLASPASILNMTSTACSGLLRDEYFDKYK